VKGKMQANEKCERLYASQTHPTWTCNFRTTKQIFMEIDINNTPLKATRAPRSLIYCCH
jgi:hypothetical protein